MTYRTPHWERHVLATARFRRHAGEAQLVDLVHGDDVGVGLTEQCVSA